MNRRLLAIVALVGLVALSGCALLTGETLEFSAQPATVSEAAEDGAQYDLVGVESQDINRSVEVLGQERRILATNQVATYERDLGVAETDAVGTVLVVSTPTMEVAGQALNPLGRISPEQALSTLSTGQDGIEGLEATGNRTAAVLGEDRTVRTFATTTTVAGQDVPTTVHFLRVPHEGDYVIGVAIHPELMSADQADVDTMFEGIEHSGSD